MSQTIEIARALAALGHETRLEVYRLLVRAGKDGLSVGEIGSLVDVPTSTLAHHLGTLVDAGLVVQERQGRVVMNRADYDAMVRTVSFLTAECCSGVKIAAEDAA